DRHRHGGDRGRVTARGAGRRGSGRAAGRPVTGAHDPTTRSRGLLREMRPYLGQVAGLLTVGSLAGIVMNTTVVLPAVLLGRAIDTALAVDRGHATAADLARAALPVPVALGLAKASGRWVTRRTLRARQANAALTGYVSEHLSGLRIIRAFGRGAATTAGLARLAGAQADAELSATRLGAWLQP